MVLTIVNPGLSPIGVMVAISRQSVAVPMLNPVPGSIIFTSKHVCSVPFIVRASPVAVPTSSTTKGELASAAAHATANNPINT